MENNRVGPEQPGVANAPKQPNAANAPEVVVKACDMCRKKKIRCEPNADGCAQCTKYKTDCHFTPISMKRKRRKPVGYKYIAELQGRLQKLEGLMGNELKTTKGGGSDGSQNGYTPFVVFDSDARSVSNQTPSMAETNLPTPPMQRSDHMECEDMRSLSLSLSSHQQNERERSIKLPHEHVPLVGSMYHSPSFQGGMALGPFSAPSFHALPPKDVALELIQESFTSFFSYFPLFDERDFLLQFERCYTVSDSTDLAWWACINVVLSMAHRFRSMRKLDVAYEDAQSCGYVHNAVAAVSGLNMLHNSLAAVQALVGMAIILQGTPNPHSSSVLTAAAMRIAQAMGLHRKNQDPTLPMEQIEQRRRVFWIAYLLDKDVSLRMGQPFAQDDDDMDAELPTGVLYDEPQNEDAQRRLDFLNARIGLAVIQGQIYRRLYSVHGSRQPETHKFAIAQELDSILSYWRCSVPVDLEGDPMGDPETPLVVESIHKIVLRFTYVNCLSMIYRHLEPMDQIPIHPALETQHSFLLPENLCVIESRKAARFIEIVPRGNYACVWLLLHPAFAAVTTLLHNVLRHPAPSQAQTDLQIVGPFLRLLQTLANDKEQCSQSDEARNMYHICDDLYSRATEAVEEMNLSIICGRACGIP